MRTSIPPFRRALPLALILLLVPVIGHAGWQPGGVTVLSTAATLRPMSACGDGGFGTFVVWQEIASGSAGVVRAQHLLASGDLDPAWPVDGAAVCDVSIARAAIGVLPDHLGGCYVWWMEGASLFATRLGAGGAIAPGWLARGRALGHVSSWSPRPSVIEDGAHGLYAAWVSDFGGEPLQVTGAHLAPDYAGVGGWPNGLRTLVSSSVPAYDLWPGLALAPDGGVFLAWASWSLDETQAPSAFLLRRLTADGRDAPGWSADGVTLGSFHAAFMDGVTPPPTSGRLAIAPDGRGGVFALRQDQSGELLPTTLTRLQGDGQGAAGWPAGGVSIDWTYGVQDAGPDGAVRVMPDGEDGAIVGAQQLYSDSPPIIHYQGYAGDGSTSLASQAGGIALGHEVVPGAPGHLFFASFWPTGPYGPWDPYAFLSLTQSDAPAGWSGVTEFHADPLLTWYGDIALAPSGDGGAVFFWSQVRDRQGLFARRFSSGGETTAVPAGAVPLTLRRLRFVAGEGVRALIALPAATAARLELFDVTGRRLAEARLETAGERDLTLPGTASLASGVYFARLVTPAATRFARVVVLH